MLLRFSSRDMISIDIVDYFHSFISSLLLRHADGDYDAAVAFMMLPSPLPLLVDECRRRHATPFSLMMRHYYATPYDIFLPRHTLFFATISRH